MDDSEQHLVAARFEVDGHVAVAVPGEDEAARRIAFDDAALHALLVGEAIRMLARRIGELVVAPDQFERRAGPGLYAIAAGRSEEHTSELQSLMRNSSAVFCLKT